MNSDDYGHFDASQKEAPAMTGANDCAIGHSKKRSEKEPRQRVQTGL
jgi:hypothetical protein